METRETMVIVNLDGATAEQRGQFHCEMTALKWRPDEPFTDVWRMSWKPLTRDVTIICTSKEDVAKAARAAGIQSYRARTFLDSPVDWEAAQELLEA